MKPINSNELINSLQADLRAIILKANQLERFSSRELEHEPSPGKWSVAQVLEHMNIYSRYYLDAIEQKLQLNSSQASAEFKPGWLGNYFTGMMKPSKDNKVHRKMSAPKNAQPSVQPDSRKMLAEFLAHQHRLLQLLEVCRGTNLDIRIPTSLTNLIKLKLGDTLRFFIAHEQRHFVQIANTLPSLENISSNTGFAFQ